MSAEFCLNLQSRYEIRLAEQKSGRAIRALPTLKNMDAAGAPFKLPRKPATGAFWHCAFPLVPCRAYNWGMLKRLSLPLSLALVLAGLLSITGLLPAAASAQQDNARRGRKYTPPPDTAHISVKVVKATNGKPIEHAAVIFHIMEGTEKNKGNMELKTNEEGKTIIDVIPIGETVRLQIIAEGFQTFGDDYKIESDTKEIIVKMKRPTRQYSTYEHAAELDGTAAPADPPPPKPADAPAAAPK